mgnify:CR=1 FL=1
MTPSLNVGLLGYGYASATFHAPLIASVPGLKLAAISSSRPADVRAHWPDVQICETPEALIARPGVVLSRTQLEEKLFSWKDDVSSNAVEVYVHGLRKKLGAGLIVNVRGVGYMVPKGS